jgi:hypothetical protein
MSYAREPRGLGPSMSQIPINAGDRACDPLFPYGYGLTY